jgi:hypothetical protein
MRAAGPLLVLWLAVHAVLLGLILGVKFLTAKTVALLFLAGTVLWLLLRRKDVPSLPAPSGIGNETRA